MARAGTSTLKGFQKGNKYAKGGARTGAGAKKKIEKEIRKKAEEIAQDYLQRYVHPIMDSWLGLAIGKVVERMTSEGKKEFSLDVDPATVRHAVDKFVPYAKTEVEHSGAIGVYRIDAFDPAKPDRKRR